MVIYLKVTFADLRSPSLFHSTDAQKVGDCIDPKWALAEIEKLMR